jgi:hypothetical protein
MANITIPGLPAKTGTISDAAYLHLNESSVDKKMTVAQLLAKISDQYSADIVTFLGSADKAEARANLDIDRRVTVDDANYTILATDKVVAQIGAMSAARTFSLPEASTVQAGAEIIVIDESGSVDSTNKITVQRNGTDTIDGLTQKEIVNPYGFLKLICDGVNSWKSLNELEASDTVKGIVELLTDAELTIGTDTTKAATAANILSLFAASSQLTNGYIRIPINIGGSFNEIIIQWGTYTGGASNPTVNLNLTFPNANLAVFTNGVQINFNTNAQITNVLSKTPSNFTAATVNSTNASAQVWDFYWMAIGY